MKKKEKIALITVLVILFSIATFNYFRNQKLYSKLDGVSNGKITNFYSVAMSLFKIEYNYTVEGVLYKGELSVDPDFKCDDGTEGCVGKLFDVKYLKSDPSISRIQLGKYKKYQTEVDLR